MTAKDIPNIISVLRMLLVIPIIYLLVEKAFAWALVLFALAGFSDALDGYLAKHYSWQSRLGSILDPLADKLLLMSAIITLAWLNLIPVWLAIVVIIRDVLIVCGGLAYHYLVGKFEMEPTFISKVNTFFQIVLVLAVVFSWGVVSVGESVISLLINVVLITTIVSGAHYVYSWGKRSIDAQKAKP